MPLLKSDADRLLRAFRHDATSTIAAQGRRIADFIEGDDWSSLIKLHALIEANVSQLIAASIGDPRVAAVIDRLPLANEGTGKLAFAKALGVIEGPQRAFIKRLSELRNTLVHDVAQVDFDLKNYVSGLSPADRRLWQDRVVWFTAEPEAKETWRNAALDNPKLTIFFSAMMLLSEVTLGAAMARNSREAELLAQRTAEELFGAGQAGTSPPAPTA